MEWVWDLVSPDPVARAEAVRRQVAPLVPGAFALPMGNLVDPVVGFCGGDRSSAAFAVLFLRWEQDFPDDWRQGWLGSPWTAKEAVLRTFASARPSAKVRAALLDLVLGAVSRRHRCQDNGYWQLARALDEPALRARLAAAPGERARYVVWLMDHPDVLLTSATWLRWRRPETVLDGLSPDQAAARLAELGPAELATTLEGLESIVAARILVRLSGQAATVAAMDVRTAARLLKALPEAHAAALLAEMPPDAAGARFPGKVGRRLLLRMEFEHAAPRLAAAPPAVAARLLAAIPPARATAFLSMMDRRTAARALAAMEWAATLWVFPTVPAEEFAALLHELPAREAARMRWQYARILSLR